jgi:hypothetical protein
MYKRESISRYILNEVETCHHLISIRLYFILTILITEDDHNHIFCQQLQLSWFFFITYNKMKKYISHCRNSSNIQ